MSKTAVVEKVHPDGFVVHYKGEKNKKRMVKVVCIINGDVGHYDGEKGKERLVKVVYNNGEVVHFEGERGKERKVEKVLSDGTVWHYEGEEYKERLVKEVLPNGTVQHYEGEKGKERLVKIVNTSGDVWHYEGEKDKERLVILVNTSGNVQHYEGEKDKERLVKIVNTSGDVAHYEGEKDKERLVKIVSTSGNVQHYEGEKGKERKVKIVSTSGNVQHYEGEKGKERLVILAYTNGDVQHYEGERGKERKVEKVLSDGNVWHYEGEKGKERKVKIVLFNGTVGYYEGEEDKEPNHSSMRGVAKPRMYSGRISKAPVRYGDEDTTEPSPIAEVLSSSYEPFHPSFDNCSVDLVTFIGDSVMKAISGNFVGCNIKRIVQSGHESWRLRLLLFDAHGQLRPDMKETLKSTDLIVLNGGLNDGDHELYDITFAEKIYRTILSPLSKALSDTKFIYLVPFKRDQLERTHGSTAFRELCRDDPHIHIVDQTDCGMCVGDFEDKIHPTVAGYSKICGAIQRVVSTITRDTFEETAPTTLVVEEGVPGQGIYDDNDDEDPDDVDDPPVHSPCLSSVDSEQVVIKKARDLIDSFSDVQMEDVDKEVKEASHCVEEQKAEVVLKLTELGLCGLDASHTICEWEARIQTAKAEVNILEKLVEAQKKKEAAYAKAATVKKQVSRKRALQDRVDELTMLNKRRKEVVSAINKTLEEE